MPRVFVPPMMRMLTSGKETVEAKGANVREVLEDLERQFPGFREELCVGDSLRPDVSVVVGENISALGMLQRVEEDSELHFLPTIAGG